MAKLFLAVLAISLFYISSDVAARTAPTFHVMSHASVQNSTKAAPKHTTSTYKPTSAVASSPLSAEAQEFLDAHNQARAQVGVAPLQWNDYLAYYAYQWVIYQRAYFTCNFANLTDVPYGSNQYWATGMTVTPSSVVSYWVNQSVYYNYTDNSCSSSYCYSYTQVVWSQTTDLGCYVASCGIYPTTSYLAICFYNPPGNYIGERPY